MTVSPLGYWRGSVLVLSIPLPPPPLQNERERSHWATNHATRNDWLPVIKNAARQADAYPFRRATVLYRYFYPVQRTRDPDGLAASTKPLTDALVAAGVLESDDIDHLALWPVVVQVDKDHPRVEIEVCEVHR